MPEQQLTEFDRHFRRLADEIQPRLSFDESAMGRFDDWQKEVRSAVLQALKVPHAESKLLDAETVSTEEVDGYIREYVRLRTEPEMCVPAYLLRPKGLDSPAPGMLALHGHGVGKIVPAGLTEGAEDELDYGVQAVRQGYVTLVPDIRGFGELMAAHDIAHEGAVQSCLILAAWANILGYTAMGMRMHDLRCCLDFLEQRSEVDADRLYLTGHSGGGMCTVFLSAIDARVKAAVPSCYVCTWRRSLMDMDHCSCNFVPGILNLIDMPDLLGLIAPRPLLIVAGRNDPLFPLAGVMEAYERAKEMYAAAGAPENLELFIGEGGHRYFAERVWPWLREQQERAQS